MHTEQLASPPRLGLRYAAALLPGRGRSDSLPDRELVLDDVQVDPDRLAAYCRLCGFGLDGTLPTTYPHVLAFGMQVRLMSEPGFPLRLPGLVHVRQRITRWRRIDAGASLALRVHAERLRAHRRGTQVDLVSELTVDGEPGWLGRSTYLAREDGATAAAAGAEDPEPPEVSSENPVARWHAGADTGRRYAGITGDVNPIHLHPLCARAFGFRGAIAHGMWSAARCAAVVGARLPDAHSLDVAFHRPVPLPSTVELFLAHRTEGWDLTLRPGRGGRSHLVASVRPAIPVDVEFAPGSRR